jgi:tripartite-type tricarboxylate transporter receptor subunit TctC
MRRLLSLLFLVIMVVSMATNVLAGQAFKPNKPVEVIVPYPAGGGQDIAARIFAKHAEEYVGQKIVVNNREGGSGTIGHTALANARPDGYTLGIIHTWMLLDQFLVEGIRYTEKSFVPLTMFAADPTIIVAHKSLGVKNATELVALAKTKRITWGGPAFSAQDYPRLFITNETGAKFTQMIFQGGAPALAAVAGGNLNVTSVFPSEYRAMADNADVVPLAVTSDARIDAFPKIPSLKEQGINTTFYQWRGYASPAGLPAEIIRFYDEAFKKTYENADFQASMKKAGFNVMYKNHADFTKYYLDGFVFNKKIVQEVLAAKAK